MKTVTYTGLFDSAEIEVAPGVWATVARGEDLEVSDRLAASLLEQSDNWAPKGARKPKTDPVSDELAAVEED